jgi:glycine cleavage system transcriptional repressor
MTEKSNLIISAVGPDAVGLIEKLSRFVHGYECNIEDSKMAVFCGDFAIILLLTGLPERLQQIHDQRELLEKETGLTILAKWPTERKQTPAAVLCRLTASSLDHPGIVHRLAHLLTQSGINIEALETKGYDAPMSGTPMFRFEGLISVPGHINLPLLRVELQALGEEENIDIELTVVTQV